MAGQLFSAIVNALIRHNWRHTLILSTWALTFFHPCVAPGYRMSELIIGCQ